MLYINTSVINNPKFIELQYLTFKKFIKDDYKFVVYNDAKEWSDFSNFYNPDIKKNITNICEKLNIECINIPNEKHKELKCPANRCADACNYMLKDHLNINDHILVLDSDMFIFNNVNIIEKYKDYEMAVVKQIREKKLPILNKNNGKYELYDINYYWNGIIYYNMPIVKNKHLLNWCSYNNNYCVTDVGGEMFKYILNTPDVKTYDIKHTISLISNKEDYNLSKLPNKLSEFIYNDPRNKNDKYFSEIYDDYIFHYRAGGNWDNIGREMHNKRTNLLCDTIMDIIKD